MLLPGEATVYVGSDFVGRMRLPLVAAGEPFIAGFGVDPQLQVSRRLVRKSRSVQGGNQIFDYEFRIGLRNYRANPANEYSRDLRQPRFVAGGLREAPIGGGAMTRHGRHGGHDGGDAMRMIPGVSGGRCVGVEYAVRRPLLG